MSGSGSPADHAGKVDAKIDGGAPASAPAEGSASNPGAGDANLSADASSASGDQGAKKDAPKPTLADVIKTAAEKGAEADQGKSPDPAKDGKVAEGEAEGAAKADAPKTETDDSKLPFHNHPRWKEVTGQNKQLTEKVATLEPQAEQFTKITDFMGKHNLSHDEVGEGFIIMAMLKNGDPRGLQKLDEYRDKLATVLGEKIPDDIKAKIESGEITEAAGKELSKARAGQKRSDDDLARTRQATEDQNRKDAAARLASDCQAATTAWETEAKKTDPDFAKKEPAIARYARALMLERGYPKTRDEAVAIVKEAYAEVNKDFASAIPPKAPVTHVPSAPSSHGAQTKPKTLAEAVAQAAAKG